MVLDESVGMVVKSSWSVRLRNCPICGESRRTVLIQLPAYRFCATNWTYREDFGRVLGISDDEAFPIVECSDCGFIYAGVLPDPQFLEAVYEKVIDPERGSFEAFKPAWVAHQLRLGALILEEVSDVFAHEESVTILDYGCGYGTLIKALANPRIRSVGFETSQPCVSHLRSSGLTVFSSLDELKAAGRFHAIILSDVLEHVPNPSEVLAICHRLLLRKGFVCVSVPNIGRRELRRAGAQSELIRGLNPWEHLNYFSAGSLSKLVRSAGFMVRQPVGPVDLGLRLGLRGRRRVRNAIGASVRLYCHLIGLRPGSTTLVGQRIEDVVTQEVEAQRFAGA